MHNKQTRILTALATIASSLSARISRVTVAKIASHNLGLPTNGHHYRRVCPPGAGIGPSSHLMSEKVIVGSRSFTRKQRKFIKSMAYSEWGRMLQK